MTHSWWAAAAGAGLILGGLAGGWLRGGRYRRGDELTQPTFRIGTVAAGALALAAVWGVLAVTQDGPDLPVALLFGLIGLAVVWIDLDVQRIPNLLTGGAAAATGTVLAVTAAVTGEWSRIVQAAAAGAAMAAAFAAVALFTSLGGGDVKLAGTVGLVLGWAGWPVLLAGLTATVLLSAAVALVLLARGRDRRSHLPFGPFLAVGGLIALTVTN